MRILLLFCALGALLGCRTVSEPSGTAIALFCSTSEQSKTDILTVGEEVAVFAGPEGTEDYFLEAAQFIVGSDGRSLNYGSTVYYPDLKQAVTFTAYLPFGGTWDGALGTFSVPADQSTALALKQADLCGATASTTPVATPVALEFRHLMARVVVITTNKPTTKIVFPNAVASGVLHAATAELVLGTVRTDIGTTGNELIVPVQPLSRLVLTVSGVEYVFDTAPVTLDAGKTTTLDLTLHPNTKTATLSGSSVTDWVATTTPGNLTQAVSNVFTVHWPKCHPQSNAVDRIVLTIKDEVRKITASHTVKGDFKYSDQTFTIPFASSALHYPYTIVSVALYQNNTEWLHESPNVLGGTIIKSGACVVGIRQPLNTPTADDYVTINGLNWAKGNLIALNNRECKIGAPMDGGIYFQFGSLIGWKGGALANDGTGVGSNPYTGEGTQWWGGATRWSWANDAMVWPAGLVGNPTSWPQVTSGTTHNWYFSGNGVSSGTINSTDVANGVGDPCTYYLGGTWRLPTTIERASITGNTGQNWLPWTTAGLTGRWAIAAQIFNNITGPGAWFGTGLSAGSGTPTASVNVFFPASGSRNLSNGSFYVVTAYGYGWSSSVYSATHGYSQNMTGSSGVIPQDYHHRSYGFPVRCVSE